MRWPAPCASPASAACAIVAPKPSSIAPAGSRWSPRPSCCGTPSISAAPWTRSVGTVSQCRRPSSPISRPWAGATSISPAITSGPATANSTPTVSGLSGAALQPWPPWQPPDVPASSAWSESVPVLSGDPDVETLHATGQLDGGEVVGREPGHHRHAEQDGPHGEHRLETPAHHEQRGRRAAETNAVAELAPERTARRPDRSKAASGGVEPRAVDTPHNPMHVREGGKKRRPGLALGRIGGANVTGRVVAQPRRNDRGEAPVSEV